MIICLGDEQTKGCVIYGCFDEASQAFCVTKRVDSTLILYFDRNALNADRQDEIYLWLAAAFGQPGYVETMQRRQSCSHHALRQVSRDGR